MINIFNKQYQSWNIDYWMIPPTIGLMIPPTIGLMIPPTIGLMIPM